MLDVKRMRVLREVAAERSFSAAGQKLGYTQSAVSQQIAALEREAGSVLIERNPRGIRLTDAGEALVRHADKILARLADAEYVHLLDDPMHLALPADHPLASRRRVRLEDLATEPWIQSCQPCACTRQTLVACANAGFEPRVAYVSDDFQVVQ